MTMRLSFVLLPIDSTSYVVFDLDDTLYPEIEFVRSGFDHVVRLLHPAIRESVADLMMRRFSDGQEVFGWLVGEYKLAPEWSIPRLLEEYRRHVPNLLLPSSTRHLLENLAAHKVPLGLLTDGRSVSQRNKVAALGLAGRFEDIIISEEFGSEKPNPRNYRIFESRHPSRSFTFIGDNTTKDFVVPAELGWRTICIKCSGSNIHPQDLSREPRPSFVVSSLDEITLQIS